MSVEAVIRATDASVTDLTTAAAEAEASGQSILAMRAWQRVLQLDPEHRAAWCALAALHEERGDTQRADACRARAGEAPQPTPLEPEPPPGAQDADYVRFAQRFGGREDTHARMWRNGDEVGWSPVAGTLTPDLVRAHVEGVVTLGAYVLTVQDEARWVVVDLDIARAALFDRHRADAARARIRTAACALAAWLHEEGVDTLVEDSGHKGHHVWVFFDPPIPGADAFLIARGLASRAEVPSSDIAVESFPKQAAVRPGGLGNLVKLPLGLHLRSGRRSVLQDASGRPYPDPWTRLRSITPADPSRLPRDARARSVPEAPPVPAVPGPRPWTTGDYQSDPHVGPVLSGCPVLRGVVEDAIRDRRIGREESVVLNHSLGHLPSGPRAVNYVYDHVPGFAALGRMGSPHRGQVVSCARIRQRLPGLAERVGCDCSLEVPAGGYAHPLLHGGQVPTVTPSTPDDAIGRWARLEARAAEVARELDLARAEAVQFLERTADHRWAGEGGDWVLDPSDSGPPIRWEPWPSSR